MYYERCQLILAEAEEADSLAAVQKGTPRGGSVLPHRPPLERTVLLRSWPPRLFIPAPPSGASRGMGFQTLDIKSRMLVNDGVSLLNAARKDFGIILAGKDLIHEAMLKGEIVQPGYAAPLRPMHLLFSPDKRQTPKLRSFIDAAISRLV